MDKFQKELINIQHREAIKDLKEQMHNISEVIKISVKIQRAYFEELVNSGFSEEQALQIVKAHGVNIGKSSNANKPENNKE